MMTTYGTEIRKTFKYGAISMFRKIRETTKFPKGRHKEHEGFLFIRMCERMRNPSVSFVKYLVPSVVKPASPLVAGYSLTISSIFCA